MILNALHQIAWSYHFYFSHCLIVILSGPVAIVRPLQVLSIARLKPLLAPFELVVEVLRMLQYSMILTVGMRMPLTDVFVSGFWTRIWSQLNHVQWTLFFYDAIGFVILFAAMNIVLFTVMFRKSAHAAVIEKIRDKSKIFARIEVARIRTATILLVKNMLLIPVSVIYLFHMLTLI